MIPLTGFWQTEVVPTLDNRWEDYRLPATDELIGPEARLFLSHFRSGKKKNKTEPEIREIDAVSALYGYGPHFETITKEADVGISQYLREEKYEHDSWQPYTYSWQYGVYDHPGSQGYHGLKAKVDSRFFILDQGGHQLYRTKLYAEKAGTYRLVQEGVVPDLILINKEEVRQPVVRLDQGWHDLLIVYQNIPTASHGLSKMVNDSRNPRQRSMVVIYPEGAPAAKEVDPYASVVASKWFYTPHVPYDPRGGEQGCWYYTFETAPGTCAMELNLNGEILQLWVDGKEIPQRMIKGSQSSTGYLIPIPYTKGVSRVTMRLQPLAGYPGSSVFTKPVKLVCKEGAMQPGDWTQEGVLAFYSGGMRYTKEVGLEFSGDSRIIFDLGTVSATCEVKVNGEEAEFMMRQPYRIDITDFAKQRTNRIEVLVYSTLSNHYQEIPSPYRGKPYAGLIGPVHLELSE
ncbi:MAG: hypothetical protein LUD15_03120 [Bacteroides sp.]|nr:hypothetical protein [Bacteroides sp.]